MKSRIFIFVPAFGSKISTTTFLSTHAIMGALTAKGYGGNIYSLSFPEISELRNLALTVWYDSMPECSHILMIDADMGIPSEVVIDMLDFDQPVVGVIYPKKTIPRRWVGSGLAKEETEIKNGFIKVEAVGGGCLLIRRDAIDTMLEQMPDLADSWITEIAIGNTLKEAGSDRVIRAFDNYYKRGRGKISEDISFCLRWRECGGEVWAASHRAITHVGDYHYIGNFLAESSQKEEKKLEERTDGNVPA